MTERKPVPPKVRFEVFKRDAFTCAYCGGKPPAVVLEVDHIDPVANGGENSIENLITTCFDCNRGKGATPLSSIPAKLQEDMERKTEVEAQLKEYRKYIVAKRRREQSDIKKVEKIYLKRFPEYEFTDSFRQVTMKRFLSMLPLHELEDAMILATNRRGMTEYSCLKYFCGICWRKFDEGKRR